MDKRLMEKTDKIISDFIIRMIANIVITQDFGSKAKHSKALKLWSNITDALFHKDEVKYSKAVINFIKWYNASQEVR